MVEVQVQNGLLEINVVGWHQLWALKKRLEVPLQNVTGAQSGHRI